MLFRFWVFPDCTFLDISTFKGKIRGHLLQIWTPHLEQVLVNAQMYYSLTFGSKEHFYTPKIDNKDVMWYNKKKR